MENLRYSQNFLNNQGLVRQLVEGADINSDQLWVDIGVGRGVITKELLKYTQDIIGYEVDRNLLLKLPEEIKNVIKETDFITSTINRKYYAFSNIPFNRTAEIMNKLLLDNNFQGGYLVIQREAFFKFAGAQARKGNSYLSILWGSTFDMEMVYEFRKTDFTPSPSVVCYLIHVTRKNILDLKFADFVSYVYENSTPTVKRVFRGETATLGIGLNIGPTQISLENFMKIYNFLLKNNSRILKESVGSFNKRNRLSNSIEKVHRTRLYSGI